jgi:hypothetical protein
MPNCNGEFCVFLVFWQKKSSSLPRTAITCQVMAVLGKALLSSAHAPINLAFIIDQNRPGT